MDPDPQRLEDISSIRDAMARTPEHTKYGIA
jgi:hypothetical protein